MADERRHSPRLKLRLNLSYTICGTTKKGVALGIDISGTGVRFVSEHDLAPGSQLDLVITLPDRAQPVQCRGAVVWSRADASREGARQEGTREVGVHFTAIQKEDQAVLAQYARFYAEPSEGAAG